MNRKFIGVLLLMFFSLRCIYAEQIIIPVIFSSHLEPYEQDWKGCREFFRESKMTVGFSEYYLDKKKPEIICSEINRQKSRLVIVLGTGALKLAKERIENIPIVFSLVLEPEEIAASNTNITGVNMDIPSRMKLEEIKRIFPNIKRVGMIYSPRTGSVYREILPAAKEMNIQLVAREINSEKEFPQALEEIFSQVDCFLMVADSKIYFPRSVQYLLLESLKKKIFLIGLSSFYTRAGALLSFDCDYKDLGKQTGEVALRILNGEKPSDLQFVRPRKFVISLNLLIAKRLGIVIPSGIIQEASEVVGEESWE
ncbi:MAG: ABC transporter substrate-binding protein [Elusimicrobiota bacterium]